MVCYGISGVVNNHCLLSPWVLESSQEKAGVNNVYYRQCENSERADLLLRKKNEKHWMNDSKSLAQKTGVFLVKRQ